MRFLFAVISFFYIAAIFILAASPVARELSRFNPYSLLHIPLYGIMTFLVVFSMVPIPRAFKIGSIRLSGDSTGSRSPSTAGLRLRLFAAGVIAAAVGILDEIHQLYVPGRDGSTGDVFLDLVGIAVALLLCLILFKTRMFNRTQDSLRTHQTQ